MLREPRVVGRALDREVDADVDPELVRGVGQACEVVDRSEFGMDRVVAPGLVPDRPRRTGIAGRRTERIVGALAVGVPDRVDRRQVDDVEAELGKAGDLVAARRAILPTSAGTARTRPRIWRAPGRPRLRGAAPGRRCRGAPACARRPRTAPVRARRRAWRSPVRPDPRASAAHARAARDRRDQSRSWRRRAAARSPRTSHQRGRAGRPRACAAARRARFRTRRSTPARCRAIARSDRSRIPRPSEHLQDAHRSDASQPHASRRRRGRGT